MGVRIWRFGIGGGSAGGRAELGWAATVAAHPGCEPARSALGDAVVGVAELVGSTRSRVIPTVPNRVTRTWAVGRRPAHVGGAESAWVHAGSSDSRSAELGGADVAQRPRPVRRCRWERGCRRPTQRNRGGCGAGPSGPGCTNSTGRRWNGAELGAADVDSDGVDSGRSTDAAGYSATVRRVHRSTVTTSSGARDDDVVILTRAPGSRWASHSPCGACLRRRTVGRTVGTPEDLART